MGKWDNHWPCQVCGFGPCSCATDSDTDATEQKDIYAAYVDKIAFWSFAVLGALVVVVALFSYFNA